MEQITIQEKTPEQKLADFSFEERTVRKKAVKGFTYYGGIIVGIFILIASAIVMTTDIHITSFVDLAQVGLNFFLIMFTSYSMFVSMADSGMRAGYTIDSYVTVLDEYNALKKQVMESEEQMKLRDFCQFYVENELRTTRGRILAEVSIPYDEYLEKYVQLDKKTVKEMPNLSKTQKKAILTANKTKPIKLTPEMILRRGRGAKHRSPIGMAPETKKTAMYLYKIFTSALISLFLGVIVLDMVAEPSFEMFANVSLKLMLVGLNGFFGYKFGFDNIVVDTADYISDQKDLLIQLDRFVKDNTKKET